MQPLTSLSILPTTTAIRWMQTTSATRIQTSDIRWIQTHVCHPHQRCASHRRSRPLQLWRRWVRRERYADRSRECRRATVRCLTRSCRVGCRRDGGVGKRGILDGGGTALYSPYCTILTILHYTHHTALYSRLDRSGTLNRTQLHPPPHHTNTPLTTPLHTLTILGANYLRRSRGGSFYRGVHVRRPKGHGEIPYTLYTIPYTHTPCTVGEIARGCAVAFRAGSTAEFAGAAA
jgi:hypothetical protein